MESQLMKLAFIEESNTTLLLRQQHDHNENENEKNVDEIRLWADLPTELLEFIFWNLFHSHHIPFLDHLRFRLTCKAWHSIGQFPLLMFFPQTTNTTTTTTTSCFNFFNPITNKQVLDQDMDIPELVDIHCSRFGWLLMSRAKHFLFFYNPFLPDSTIELPEIKTRYFRFVSMSFTAPPNSSECIVYAHDEPRLGSVVVIHKWCYGEDDWTDYQVDSELSFVPSASSPIFFGGVFHQLDVYGRLGVSDPKKGANEHLSWKDLELPNKIAEKVMLQTKAREDLFPAHYTKPQDIFSSHCNQNYMAECDGELVVVLVGYSRCEGKPIHVFRLDWSRMEWVTVQSLGNKAMFICDTGSLLIKTNGRTGAENKIYFPMFVVNKEEAMDGGHATKKVGVFYSLENRKYNFSPEHWKRSVMNCTWIDTNFQL